MAAHKVLGAAQDPRELDQAAYTVCDKNNNNSSSGQ
jgi:hypothetical protein